MNAYLSAARELVTTGIEKSRTPLTPALEAHLSFTVARFMDAPVKTDLITVQYYRAVEERAKRDRIREIGDCCLISCGLFPERIRKSGGRISYYAGLGQGAYDQVGMTEAAWGFSSMLDVLSSLGEGRTARNLLDLARGGSSAAEKDLRKENVILFSTEKFRRVSRS